MLSFFKKKTKEEPVQAAPKELKAFLSGRVIPIEEVPDEVFSAKVMGDGLAVEPADCTVIAPAAGEVAAVMEESRHACGLKLDNGMEVLIHVGLDTVDMNGDGFEMFVKMGDRVNCGDPLLSFDPEKIKAAGHPTVTVMVITDEGEAKNIRLETGMTVKAGQDRIASFE